MKVKYISSATAPLGRTEVVVGVLMLLNQWINYWHLFDHDESEIDLTTYDDVQVLKHTHFLSAKKYIVGTLLI